MRKRSERFHSFSCVGPRFVAATFCTLLFFASAPLACGQAADLHQVTAAQQLALEQLDQLIGAGEAEAAVDLAVRIIDESDGRLVASSRALDLPQAAPPIETFVPLEVVVHDRLLQSAREQPRVLELYRETYDRLASDALQEAADDGSVDAIEAVLRRYFATSYGDDALMQLADATLRRGWLLRARDALRRIDPRWQPHQQAASGGPPVAAVDWSTLLARVDDEALLALATEVASRDGRPLGSYQGSDISQSMVAARLVYCHLLSGDRDSAEKLATIATRWFPDQQVQIAGRSGTVPKMMRWLLQEAGPWPDAAESWTQPRVIDWSTVGGHLQRAAQVAAPNHPMSTSPRWTAEIPGAPFGTEWLLPESLRRAGRRTQALSVPILHDGRIFLAAPDGIAAWDVETGQVWPAGAESGLLFHAAENALDIDARRLPIDSLPRRTLTARGSHLVCRFGSVLTGRPAALLQQPSASRIGAFDLEAEGALLEGYPVEPPAGSEFEGTPLVVGSRLFVGISRRDEATRQSQIVCYDLLTGQPLWTSPPLSQLRQPVSQDVGHASHALASHCEGLIYFQSHQATAAAVDASTGRLRWLVRYPRRELAEGPYEKLRAAEGKRLSPVAIAGSHAVICAADLDRVIAVDPIDGRLQWATAPGVGDDVHQVLGTIGRHLVMAGQRLYWFEADSGRLAAAFPAAATRQTGGGLAQPSGAGKGVMADGKIYWPTREAIFVFAGELSSIEGRAQPRLIQQIDLKPWGLTGGHLAMARGFLVNAGPQHVAVFGGRLRLGERSMKLTE